MEVIQFDLQSKNIIYTCKSSKREIRVGIYRRVSSNSMDQVNSLTSHKYSSKIEK